MTKEQVSGIESLGVKTYSTEGLGDFISLTNLAAKQGSASLLDDWLKNKNTIEFLGIWEQLNNPDFDNVAYANIMASAGLNRFRLPVKKWVSETHAIGIRAKSGRFGGTFAHIDPEFPVEC